MRLTYLFVLATCALSYVQSEDDRDDLSNGDEDVAFSKLPADIQSDFSKILTGVENAIGGSCLGVEPNYDKIELLLYTGDTHKYTKLDPKNPVGIDYSAPLYLLTHDWLSGLRGYKIKGFRDKYINRFGKNVIFINWGRLAWHPYTTVYCNIPFMAKYVANFLCDINVKNNYPLNKVEIVGHGVGGQFAGLIGKSVQKTCKEKLGKIVSLDPAGPMYQLAAEENRIGPTDAESVEVIHSSAGTFGYLGNCGTVDFHLNCGSLQPGCVKPTDLVNIPASSISILSCSHLRALEMWPHVLESRDFKAKSCKLCPAAIPGTCISDKLGAAYVSMGYTPTTLKSQRYNVITGLLPPYHLGCLAYLLQGCS